MTFQDNSERPQEHTLEDALTALQSVDVESVTLPPAVFYGLSDLPERAVKPFLAAWEKLPDKLRMLTARLLVETGESNFELHYERVGLALLADPLYSVRVAAIELLWESQGVGVMDRLLTLLETENQDLVKSEVLKVLGRYILLGEYGDIPAAAAERAQATALRLWETPGNSTIVRRRALEALSNSSRPGLYELIRAAYADDNQDMRVSAVYAMGRSCDPRWEDTILQEIESGIPEMQYEAVRASGEIELNEALPNLARLVYQHEDRELQEVSIWAMGEIGGSEAIHYLSQLADALEESEDTADLKEYIDDAIQNAEMNIDIDALTDT